MKLDLTEEEMRRLEEHYVPHPVLGHVARPCGPGDGVSGWLSG